MRDPVQLFRDEVATAGTCRYCGGQYVLWWRVVYYREFSVRACQLCGVALGRHVRWQGEARRKAAEIRLQRAQAQQTEAS